MVKETHYYDLLGVSPTADDAALRKGYRKQALLFHPDKNNSPDAESQFKEILEAYQVLSDPEKRAIYDEQGREGLAAQGQAMDPIVVMVQLHRHMFGDGAFDALIPSMAVCDEDVVRKMHTLMGLLVNSPEHAAARTDLQRTVEAHNDAQVARLAQKLVERINAFASATAHADRHQFLASFRAEMANLATTIAGGAAILEAVGTAYVHVAKQKDGKYFGMKKAAYIIISKKHQFGLVHDCVKTSMALREAAANNSAATSEGSDSDAKIVKLGLLATWQMGLLEIDAIVRKACVQVLSNIAPSARAARVEAIRAFGDVLLEVAKAHGASSALPDFDPMAYSSPRASPRGAQSEAHSGNGFGQDSSNGNNNTQQQPNSGESAPSSPPPRPRAPPSRPVHRTQTAPERPQTRPAATSPQAQGAQAPTERVQSAQSTPNAYAEAEQEQPLPYGWSSATDSFGRRYFISPMGVSQWQRPVYQPQASAFDPREAATLPPGWALQRDPFGRKYYISPFGTSQWTAPCSGASTAAAGTSPSREAAGQAPSTWSDASLPTGVRAH